MARPEEESWLLHRDAVGLIYQWGESRDFTWREVKGWGLLLERVQSGVAYAGSNVCPPLC